MIHRDSDKKCDVEDEIELDRLKHGLKKSMAMSDHIPQIYSQKPRTDSISEQLTVSERERRRNSMRTTHSSDIPVRVRVQSMHFNTQLQRLLYLKPKGSEKDDPIQIQKFRPLFTYSIIFINCIVFIVILGLAGFEHPTKNPMLGPPIEALVKYGAKDTDSILAGEWWRLFTSMFLHGGILHLFLNMAVFYRVGGSVENFFGGLRVAPIYLLSALASSTMSAIFLTKLPSVGASGAIYGMIGSLFGDYTLHKNQIPNPKKYIIVLTISTLIGLVIGLFPLMDNYAHIGGLVCGYFVSLCIFAGTETNSFGHSTHPTMDFVARILGALCALAWIIGLLATLFSKELRDHENWCPECYRMSCVDTPWWTCDNFCAKELLYDNGTRICVDP